MSPSGWTSTSAAGGAYVAVIAALAAHTADRLGAHNASGSTGSVCRTALGAVAVCTSSTGLACPVVR